MAFFLSRSPEGKGYGCRGLSPSAYFPCVWYPRETSPEQRWVFVRSGFICTKKVVGQNLLFFKKMPLM